MRPARPPLPTALRALRDFVGTRRHANMRKSGRASANFEGEWFGVSKVPLTVYVSQGKDALISDVPSAVIDVLRLVCSEQLVVVASDG